jgi:hypothetical protein
MIATVFRPDAEKNAAPAKSGSAERLYFGCEVIQFKNKRPSCDALLFYPDIMKKFHSFPRTAKEKPAEGMGGRQTPLPPRSPAAPLERGRRG